MAEANPSKIDRDFLKTVLALAAKKEVSRLLYVHDEPLPAEDLRGRPIKRKLVYAVSNEQLVADLRDKGFSAVLIPPYDYARIERIKVAIVGGLTSGQLKEGQVVLATTGLRSRGLDTIMKIKLGSDFDERVSVDALDLPEEFHGPVVEALLDLALRIGHDGFEGHPIGSLVVLGDAIAVMEKSRQLTINPFQGISESERNLLDPRIREAIRNFSVLDGAFVVREDGVVMAAGRYLQASTDDVKVPLGLGARHTAAAAITQDTDAIAISVSQTSGSVRVFRDGEIILELHQPARRM
jgi:diadenylate cyclase